MIPEIQRRFPNDPPSGAWENWNQWERSTNSLRQHFPNATVFETKVLYIFGMIRHLLETTGWAMRHESPFYFPAYFLACDAVELMGRCDLDGEDPSRFGMALRRGLEKLILTCPHCERNNIRGSYTEHTWIDDESHIVITVQGYEYTIRDCRQFRNFMAHGMADPSGTLPFTAEFLGRFICNAAIGTNRFYQALCLDAPEGEVLRNRLANARVLPIWDNDGPIHIRQLYGPLMQPPFGMPCGTLLYENSWRRFCVE